MCVCELIWSIFAIEYLTGMVQLGAGLTHSFSCSSFSLSPTSGNQSSSQASPSTANLSFPTNLSQLKHLARVLSAYNEHHGHYVLLLYSSAYLFKQTFAVPGSFFMVSSLPIGGCVHYTTLCTHFHCKQGASIKEEEEEEWKTWQNWKFRLAPVLKQSRMLRRIHSDHWELSRIECVWNLLDSNSPAFAMIQLVVWKSTQQTDWDSVWFHRHGSHDSITFLVTILKSRILDFFGE